ncbi:MAG: translation initiation factor IF-2 [Candidatus Krumholzibacteriia bacterium]
MRKLRVYELARHYGVDSKTIMTLLHKMKADAKSHMSVVEEPDVDKVHSVFQRKRELARQNYARAHNLDPEKLKNVASLKPLPKPQPAEEPEEKAPRKKTVRKKKPAKPKVVVIKKAGVETAVARKARELKEAEEKARAERAAAERAERERVEAERAAMRDAHAQTRQTARLVKKVRSADEAEVGEAAETAAAGESPRAGVGPAEDDTTTGAPAGTAGAPPVETDQEIAPGLGESAGAAATVEPAETDAAAAEAPAEEAPPAGNGGSPAEAEAEAEAAPEADSPAAEEEESIYHGPRHRSDGFKVGDIIKPPQAGAAVDTRSGSNVSKESVKESVKAAIRKRQEERDQRESAEPRRKRARTKKKKVDEAAVERQVKQTMAQLETGGGRRRRRKGGGTEAEVAQEETVRVTEFITVQEFAEKLEVPARDVIGKLFSLGIMATINQRLEKEQIDLLADEYDRDIEFMAEYGEELLEQEEVAAEDLTARAPVVTVMGHVDHGKTLLLDRIRQTNVVAGEAGGITQHIGAYMVQTPGGPITFLDTPGHAAFTAMRARGASVTDIVILVVAANDGVMPQTVEAINHAKAAGVPIIVAINKIDLPEARAERVKQELAQQGILIEEYGGTVLAAEISAKQSLNIERLLEMVHLQAEVLELTASAKGGARGVVVEARKEPGRGVVFTVLIEKGTLKVGDIFLVGVREGRVRALLNERGEKLNEARPGQPAEVLGANDVPEAGDRFYVMESEREAREIASRRKTMQRQQQYSMPKRKIGLENLADMMEAGDLKELPIIIKGDVAGSVEAVADQLMELNTAEVQVKVVHKAVGAITESDVLLAANIGAMIIGFHLRPGAHIEELAREHNVTIENFDIIYEAVDTLKKAMAGLLGSIQREVSTGKAEVRQVFTIPKVGQIAGSMVTEGKIVRNGRARLVRDQVMIFEGRINSLKRFKEDAREVAQGYECGIGLENFHNIQEGDIIEAYEIEEVVRTEL